MDAMEEDAEDGNTWPICGAWSGAGTGTGTGAGEDIEPADNLWTAASNGDMDRVLELLTQDPSLVNAKDDNGYSAL
jgi:hypothetical protein